MAAMRAALAIRLVFALSGALLTLALAGPAMGQTAEDELAEKWAPVLQLKEQEEKCGKGEPYEPVDVDVVLDNAEVAFRGPWDNVNLVRTAPNVDDVSRALFGYHLDFPGEALNPGCDFEEWQERLAPLGEPTMYARVVMEPAYPDRLALQYWFFYVFNDFNNKHEGDWEMIQLNFDAATAEEALAKDPVVLGYSQHEGGERAEWGDDNLDVVDGTHPVAYPASGSHANYFTPQLFLGRSAAQGVGCDDSTGPSRQLRPQVALIPTDEAAYLSAYPWLGFEGRWGERQPAFYNGPTGPNTKPQWTAPITWSEDTWRDQAFPIPGGTTLLPAATDFFCEAVEAGSDVLIAVTRNPALGFIVLGAFLGLLVWGATRTRWTPSQPLRLERRRGSGQALNASRRLYTRHLRLFATIGLVFVPIAVFVAGLQALLFLLTDLGALADSAGESNPAVSGLAVAIGLIFNLVGLGLVQAVVVRAMLAIDRGQPITAREAYRQVFAEKRVRTLIAAVLIITAVAVPLTITFFLIPVAIWLLIRWSLTVQALEIEGLGARDSLRRSSDLVRGRLFRTGFLVLGVATLAAVGGPLIGALVLLGSSAAFWVVNLIAGIIYVFAFPFVAVVTTYIYFNLRVRHAIEPDTSDSVLPRELPIDHAASPTT
jgi:hypothetical protein